MDIIKRIDYLKELLNKNNYLYYIKQNPELTDSEYDTYFRELIELENRINLKKRNKVLKDFCNLIIKNEQKIIK